MITWLACGAATNMTGPSLGILCAPLGFTSRKKTSNIKLNNHSATSYVNLCKKGRLVAMAFLVFLVQKKEKETERK